MHPDVWSAPATENSSPRFRVAWNCEVCKQIEDLKAEGTPDRGKPESARGRGFRIEVTLPPPDSEGQLEEA